LGGLDVESNDIKIYLEDKSVWGCTLVRIGLGWFQWLDILKSNNKSWDSINVPKFLHQMTDELIKKRLCYIKLVNQ
jgi:hypothetical protein